MTGDYKGNRFEFDDTEQGFIRAAKRAGLKVSGECAYLHHDGLTTLIRVLWNDATGRWIAGAVVSLEPLHSILIRLRPPVGTTVWVRQEAGYGIVAKPPREVTPEGCTWVDSKGRCRALRPEEFDVVDLPRKE